MENVARRTGPARSEHAVRDLQAPTGRMRRSSLIIFLAFVLPAAAGSSQTSGVPFEAVVRPAPGAWPTYHGRLDGNRFSGLDQINASTIRSLAPKWLFTIQGAP